MSVPENGWCVVRWLFAGGRPCELCMPSARLELQATATAHCTGKRGEAAGDIYTLQAITLLV